MSTTPYLSKFDSVAQSDYGSFPLSPDDLDFFKTLTKIDEEKQLREHIIDVQKAAYEVFSYPCIRKFAFVRSQKDPILLDIGRCFGTDVRKVVLDGWPAQNVIASDIRKGNFNTWVHYGTGADGKVNGRKFWDYGHKLFLSTSEGFPVKFIAGDILNPSFLQPREPFLYDTETPVTLSDIQSLTPLQGKVSAIHASSLFHLFDEQEQFTLACRLASLLRPEKGSVIFGQHTGRKVMGYRPPYIGHLESKLPPMFCHLPLSWTDLWVTHVFGMNDGRGNERIRVDVEFIDVDWVDGKEIFNEVEPDDKTYMQWCITHL